MRDLAASLDRFFGQFFLFLAVIGFTSHGGSTWCFGTVWGSSSDRSSTGKSPAVFLPFLSWRIVMASVMVGWWLINHSRRSLRSSVKTSMCLVVCCSTSLLLVFPCAGSRLSATESRMVSASGLSRRLSLLRCLRATSIISLAALERI